jgi:hypothetical protein
MFGFGTKRRSVRNDTFSANRIRGAALAGLGMLAWRWFRNRQTSGSTTANPSQPYSGGSSRSTNSY